jgi:serine/threonine protein kinase
MELVRARSLTELIEESGALPPQEVARIGLQVLAALGAAHGAGINHRDVKPGNVLCTGSGRVVLTDFGIASLEGDASTTITGPLMGSPSYIAPERVRGHPATPASDIWSLAATLYAAVEGRPPYDRDGVVQTVTAVVTDDPDPYRLAGPLTSVLSRMFRKDPADRPSAAQIRMMLREVAGPPNHRDAPEVSRSRAAAEAAPPPAKPQPAEATVVAALPARDAASPVIASAPESERAAGERASRVVPSVLVAFAVLMLLAGGTAALNSLRGDPEPPVTTPTGPPAALEQSETPSPSLTPTAGPATPTTTPTGDGPQRTAPPTRPGQPPTFSPKPPPTKPAPTKPAPTTPPPASPTPDPPSSSPPATSPPPVPPEPPADPPLLPAPPLLPLTR